MPSGGVYVRVAAVASELRAGARAAVDPRFEPPHASSPVRRFLHGVGLPFKVLRALWRDRAARREYLRLLFIEVIFVAPLAVLIALGSDEVADAATGTGWRTWLGETLAFLGALYLAASVFEWIAIWLAREFHDDLGFRASTLTYVPGEALDHRPRVRFDVGFLWLKARRKLRAFLLIGVGIPFLGVLWFVPVVGHALYAVALGAWAAYWAGVFAVANTHLAWERDGVAGPPWFVRWLERLALIPGLGLPAVIVLPFTRKISRSVYAACEAFAEAPWEGLGLALAKEIIGVPVLWLALRPVFAPAATHALLGARYASGALVRSSAPPEALPGQSP